ncbi:MAG: PEP-CTERM sorting domain-containing protein [Bacteroidaceae bacterium]|nr:PEP-CTERM sorting domain-containing protein [Bacteroidaceae bacterium]
MYNVKTVINKSLTLSGFNLEGWQPLLQVTTNSIFTATFDKLQFNGASITVDEGSTFNMKVVGDYKDYTGNFYINGTLNLDLDYDNGIPSTVFTLGDNASLSVSNSTTNGAVTLNANLIGNEAGVIYTRDLLTYNNAAFTNVAYNFGEGWTNVGDGEITGANQYKITNNTTGISVSYMAVAPIPEPTTATLSLLALAGLAARRRRASR